jgi:hypothetical protein
MTHAVKLSRKKEYNHKRFWVENLNYRRNNIKYTLKFLSSKPHLFPREKFLVDNCTKSREKFLVDNGTKSNSIASKFQQNILYGRSIILHKIR